MSQPALPNRHLFSSSWTQLIVTAEKLSLSQIYKAQKRGGGFGGNSTALGTTGVYCWPGMMCCGSCPHPRRHCSIQGSLLLCGACPHSRSCPSAFCHPPYPTHTTPGNQLKGPKR